MKAFWASAWEIVEIIFISLVTVFLIRNFLAQPFLVSGASMEPEFSNRDYLIIDEITYRFREPQRGEAIVFRYPNDPSVYFIKRIIGLPGERVIIRGGDVTVISGDEEIQISGETNGRADTRLGEGEYFVLGDNRYNSFDSRNWGPIKRDDIIGLVRLRVFPLNEIEIIKTPVSL